MAPPGGQPINRNNAKAHPLFQPSTPSCQSLRHRESIGQPSLMRSDVVLRSLRSLSTSASIGRVRVPTFPLALPFTPTARRRIQVQGESLPSSLSSRPGWTLARPLLFHPQVRGSHHDVRLLRGAAGCPRGCFQTNQRFQQRPVSPEGQPRSWR